MNHPRARSLRRADNQAEAMVWNALKAKQLGGYKFARQFPIGPYFADFAQRQHHLVIEVDGSQHIESIHDLRRNEFMRDFGFAVLRLWSGNVINNMDGTCTTILAALAGEYQTEVLAHDMKYLPARAVVGRYLRRN